MSMSLKDLTRLNEINKEFIDLSNRMYELREESNKILGKYNDKIIIRRHKVE